MAERVDAIIKPGLLTWARESLGLGIETAAKKAQVKSEQLLSWERGEKRPTINQLRKLGSIYKRPIAVFYLPEPPTAFDALHDYRRLPGGVPGSESPELRLEIRRAHDRRQVALDLFEVLQEEAPPFGETATLSDNPEVIGSQIRGFLGITQEQQVGWQNDYEALNQWRSALEGKGVLVFQATDVEVGEMRGFSISETPLPVVVVNIKDSPRGRIFTMLHEFAHILLKKGGLCDLEEDRSRPPEEQRVEVLCNHVSGAALIPKDSLLAEETVRARRGPTDWPDQDIELLARRYKASREATLRRLLLCGRTTEAFYRRKREEYLKIYEERSEREVAGFVPPYRLAISRAGPWFVRLVLEGYSREKITTSDLADYLRIRLKHLPRLERELLGTRRNVRG